MSIFEKVIERIDMRTMVGLMNILLPVAYAAAVWTYGNAFFRDSEWARSAKSRLLYGLVTFHALYLAARTIAFAHPPATTIFEILTLLAFSISLIYLAIELRSSQKDTGYFILMLSLFFQLFSSLFIRDLETVPDVLRSNLFGFHVTAALLGYSAIALSAAYAFLYLMLYHEIKKTRFGVIYRKLPNLASLERMSSIALVLAFLLLAVAIGAGFVWLPRAFLSFSYADPKLVGTVVLWLIYGAALFLKQYGDWKGRKLMILSISGFAFSILSMTVINVFFSGFHRFY